jgi:hypothetical protein
MFVGNFKSRDDERMKRLTQMNLLKVMAENEEENEKRVKDFKNPYAPNPVPPPFKTAGERRAEAVENEKLASDNLRSIVEFSANELSSVISTIRESDLADAIFTFNSYFPQIKTRILKSLNPKLIDAKYLGKFIVDFLRETVRINPLRMTDEGIMISSNYGDVMALLATKEDVLNFIDVYAELVEIPDKAVGEILEGYKTMLVEISTLHLDKGLLAELKTQLTQKELEIASSQIQSYYTKNKLMDKDLLASFTRDIKSSKNSPTLAKVSSVASKILKRIESINIVKAQNSFINLKKKIDIIMSQDDFDTMVKDVAEQRTLEEKKSLASKQAQEGEGGQTTQQAFQSQTTGTTEGLEESKGAEEKEEKGDDEGAAEEKGDDEGAAEEEDDDEEVSQLSAEDIQGFVSTFNVENITYINELVDSLDVNEVVQIVAGIVGLKPPANLKPILNKVAKANELVSYDDYLQKINKASGTDATMDGDLKAMLRNLISIIIDAKEKAYSPKTYNPIEGIFGAAKFASSSIPTYPAGKKGFGMVKNHRVMKPAVMPVMPNKPLKIGRGQMKKDELQFQVDLEKAKKKRGQPKAITGKGVCVEVPEDTYKTFGKHIIHYPQLRDMNTLNVKYPSKSKNYVPKLVVSAYYKDLMMDLLERGKYSDTLLDKLEESEKEHFHKIVKGAGLLEQFKLKTPSNDKIKQSAERFKVLRGNFLAGNNSPTLITELRSLILAFMERDIIQKKDGYEMLRELS